MWVQNSQTFVCPYDVTPDAGTPCNDKSECHGSCIAKAKVSVGTKSSGICSSKYSVEVAQYVTHGIVGPELWQ